MCGMEGIRKLEKFTASVLLISLILHFRRWIRTRPVAAAEADRRKVQEVFFPSLTVNINFLVMVANNIPDFVRYARCQVGSRAAGGIAITVGRGMSREVRGGFKLLTPVVWARCG
jgi:cytosine/uracil/thiamine/allantoin permease